LNARVSALLDVMLRMHARASAEMHRLVETLRSVHFQAAHPALQAAYAHYALVPVHPFADGNGRVARALASVFLRRAVGIPLLLWGDQRTEYFEGLEAADTGRFDRFAQFVFDLGVEAIRLVGSELSPRPDRIAKTLVTLAKAMALSSSSSPILGHLDPDSVRFGSAGGDHSGNDRSLLLTRVSRGPDVTPGSVEPTG
jgi:prophage maintenance system killer protein